jgi:putative ABC transport system permease protein
LRIRSKINPKSEIRNPKSSEHGMESSYLVLTYWQVALAALLIVVNGAVSVGLRLGLARSLAVGGVRMILQLLLIGLVLEWVFRLDRWYIVLALTAVMTLVAGVTAVERNQRRYPGIWFDTIVSVWASSWLIAAYAIFVVLRGIDTWYHPQYTIPLLGMILGNTLNGISIGLGTFTETLLARRGEVETLLALGATRWEASRSPMRHALRTGLTPIINSMMVAGIVSLPGMMTGQLLAGVAPIQAVKYQIVIMFLIASATALGATGVVLLGFRRLFTADHQFLHSRLQTNSK